MSDQHHTTSTRHETEAAASSPSHKPSNQWPKRSAKQRNKVDTGNTEATSISKPVNVKGAVQRLHADGYGSSDDVFGGLSSSAPSAPVSSMPRKNRRVPRDLAVSSDEQWDMPAQASGADDSFSGLTWQQELLGMKKAPSHDGSAAKKRQAGAASSSTKAKTQPKQRVQQQQQQQPAGLTWQQEMIAASKTSSNSPRHGHGIGGSENGAATHRRGQSAGAVHTQAPSTPGKQQSKSSPANKMGGAAAPSALEANGGLMYAGPNFHNSPSPASLPAPKFMRNRPAVIASDASEELELPVHNSLRGYPNASSSSTSSLPAPHTAPLSSSSGWPSQPSTHSSGTEKEQTIETLLAKLMS